MEKNGRTVSLATLAGWRREGLLPPLASHGLGMGKGKSYYWKETDIVAHASAAFDLLHKHGRPEVAVWMLWLSGFPVPLPQLRRVWAYRSKARKMWTARPIQSGDFMPGILGLADRAPAGNQNIAAQILLEATLALGGSLVPDDGDSASILQVLERAIAWMSRANGYPKYEHDLTAQRLWLVVRIVCAALENSDFVSIVSDAELRDAQKYLRLTGILLGKCDDRTPEETDDIAWPTWLAERMAAPAFLLVLVLLRSGHEAMLEQMAARIERMDRQVRLPPVQHSYSAA
jgi:hypothetical protein